MYCLNDYQNQRHRLDNRVYVVIFQFVSYSRLHPSVGWESVFAGHRVFSVHASACTRIGLHVHRRSLSSLAELALAINIQQASRSRL